MDEETRKKLTSLTIGVDKLDVSLNIMLGIVRDIQKTIPPEIDGLEDRVKRLEKLIERCACHGVS